MAGCYLLGNVSTCTVLSHACNFMHTVQGHVLEDVDALIKMEPGSSVIV